MKRAGKTEENQLKTIEEGLNRQLKNETDREKPRKTSSKTSVSSNREFAVVAYIFLVLFLILMAYFLYFMVLKKDTFINSPYNPRLDSLSETVVRGKIISGDGEVLAYTQTDSEGKETRVYPYGRTFAHVVGYSSNGKSGIESVENFDLLRSHSFFLEQIINDLKGEKNIGDNVITTLDTKVQSAAYHALGGYNGAVVVLEPSTGKVISMVSKPDFDANSIAAEWDSLVDSDSSVLLNRATQGLYPPGSIFKVVTTLEYLNENSNPEAYHYDCTGTISDGSSEIHCYGGSVHGSEDLYTSFAKSCNTSYANIGLGLNIKKYNSLCNSLLFNEKIKFDLTTKASSFSLSSDAGTSLIMQTAIGQGETLVTPFHMAALAAAICNDGTLMQPYLIDHIESENGEEMEHSEPETYTQLLSEEDAKTMQEYLSYVVSNGTASALSGQGYAAAGKTGTAEFNSNKDSHAWFIGYASKEGSEDIAVAVIVEDSGAGSTYAVPVAKAVFDTYFTYH